jgi:DNA end-binding protein Ku
MAARANWKGVLKIADVSCPVALYTAASTAERISFHILNRKTGDRVHRQFVDERTGKPVPAEDQVKGYETDAGDYITFEPEEIAKAVPEADKTLDVQAFIPCDQVDDVYFDRPYYLAPSTQAGAKPFVLIRDGMARANVVAVARTVLFRRVRSLLVRAHGNGLIAHTLNFDYEVRSAEEAFRDVTAAKTDQEMLDLALHIIQQKKGRFDPTRFDDRYDAALRELVKAKMEGRKITPLKAPEPTQPANLMEALRQSAAGTRGPAHTTKHKRASRPPKRTAKPRTHKKTKPAKRRKAA